MINPTPAPGPTTMLSPQYRHQPVIFSADQNQVDVGGHKLTAADHEAGRCGTCAFKDGFGCSLWRDDSETNCQPDQREDGRSIIWVSAT